MSQPRINRTIIPIIVTIAVVIGIGVFVYSTNATAQITNLGQVANSVEKLYPQATSMPQRVESVNGVTLATIARSDQSVTIDRTTGVSKSKAEFGRATLELQHGVTQSGNDVISATITNNSKETIYLTSLIIFGQTDEGMEPLNAYVIDSSYSPEVFGNIPQPTVVKPTAIAPGESYSGYISGKWNMFNQPIRSFSVGAVYKYDVNAQDYVPSNNWSISVDATKLT